MPPLKPRRAALKIAAWFGNSTFGNAGRAAVNGEFHSVRQEYSSRFENLQAGNGTGCDYQYALRAVDSRNAERRRKILDYEGVALAGVNAPADNTRGP